MLLQAPSIVLSQLISIVCNFMNCEPTYPSPVSLLPRGFRAAQGRSINAHLGRQFGNGPSEVNDSVSSNEIEDMSLPFVATRLGVVEGYFMTVLSGREIYAFEGIPYAEPPVGNNRFRAPKPKKQWAGILEAKDPGPICIQLNVGQVQGEEDCLRLNIYTPKLPSGNSNPKLPVIIYIHGVKISFVKISAFMFGSGSWKGPAYLLEQDVILVTFNFRLGILGFMSTGDEVASGNYGLKDQAMSINWIYDNIEQFGGDQKRITLAGQSSGSVSTHLQMMSPFAQDKFVRAISLSGGAYNFWGINSCQVAKNIGLTHGALALCPLGNSQAMIDCMRKVDAGVLVANQLLSGPNGFPVASIEPNVTGAFITESPDMLYAQGKVAKIPWIITVTSNESTVFMAGIQARGALPFLQLLFDAEAPILLGLTNKVDREHGFEIAQKVKEFYGVRNDPVLPKRFFSEIGSDRFFNTAFHKQAQMHSQIAPTYAGIFGYSNNLGYAAYSGLDPQELGVGHNEDLIFFLNSTYTKPISRDDRNFAVTKFLVNVFTNFVETGEPMYLAEDDNTYRIWDANRNPNELKLLDINRDVKMIPDPFKRTSDFWESLGIPDTSPYLKL